MALRRRVGGLGEDENIEIKYDSLIGNDDKKYGKHNKDSVSSIVAVFVIILSVLMFDFVVKLHHSTPAQLKIVDEKNNPNRFIGERAQNHLKNLVSIGQRITGSYENEVLTVDFLKRELSFIIQQKNKQQLIELDVQKISGSYYLDFLPYGLVNVYDNLQNVVVKMHSANNSSYSLLVNCHYDSVPVSPGASDNGINCAAMIETIRVLSKKSVRPLHNIIFLFNGAEENPLQASHGFIAHHKYANSVRVVVNLDAGGAGGRELLFQSGPGNKFILESYAKNAPHPFGNSAGEEVFHANLIPSDTDFRVFRDFGRVPGLDMAFVKNGYVYHTKFDDLDQIDDGSFQHIGDNVLSLVETLSNHPQLPKASLDSKDKSVYFDLIGWKMIFYSDMEGIFINFFISLLSVLVFLKFLYDLRSCSLVEVGVNFFLSGIVQLGGICLSIFFALVIGYFMDTFGAAMSWYSRPRIIFGLFMCPALILLPIPLILLKNILENVTLTLGQRTQMFCHTNRFIWTFLLIVSTLFAVRVSHLFMIPVLFNTLGFLIIGIFNLSKTRRVWLYIYLFFSIFPMIFSMYFLTVILEIFIPISGRFGSDRNPDDYIGIISTAGIILISSSFIPLVALLKTPVKLLIGLLSIFLITLSLILFTNYGFPYSGSNLSPSPQRYWIFHTNRVFYNEIGEVRKKDSGIFLLNMDRNSPKIIENIVPDIKNSVSIENDCNEFIYCGFPIYTSRMLSIHRESTWIPYSPALIRENVSLKLIKKVNITGTINRYYFRASGPDHYTIFISPKPLHKVKQWSFIGDIPSRAYMWNGRPTYFVLYGYGERKDYYDFWIDVDREPGMSGRPAMDIALSGKYTHHDMERTKHFNEFLESFPEWAHSTAWIASYVAWVY